MAAPNPQPPPSTPSNPTTDEEIVPYKLHVSSKYLKLTEQKLELTRLPRESSESESHHQWNPKPEIEALVDFWLEEYSWRDEEKKLNASVPQFRTAISLPGPDTSVRLHFIHARSPHSHAVPLLLIPPFPFSNLSLSHLVPSLTDPEDAGFQQPFHVVLPSVPGSGRSDALPENISAIPTTARAFNTIMQRLGYTHYCASSTGVLANSPSQVDWKLVHHLAHDYSDSCVGVHLISPPLEPPRAQESPVHWLRWKLASISGRPRLGYTTEDIVTFQKRKRLGQQRPGLQSFDFDLDKYRDPNVLSYALCDSPAGLLLFVVAMLQILGGNKDLPPAEVISLAEMMWMPGPEGTLRFWANCASQPKTTVGDGRKTKTPATRKPMVGITVFVGENGPHRPDDSARHPLRPSESFYACPGWAGPQYEVVSTTRVAAQSGLLAWESPDVILDGTRSMVKAVLAIDKRLQTSGPEATEALADLVVVRNQVPTSAEVSDTTILAGSDETTPTQQSPRPASPAAVLAQSRPPLQTRSASERASSTSQDHLLKIGNLNDPSIMGGNGLQQQTNFDPVSNQARQVQVQS